MKRLYKVCPNKNKYISGILPSNKRIVEPTYVEDLSKGEFLRCMALGKVYAIIDGEDVQIKSHDYDAALKLFPEIGNNPAHAEGNKDTAISGQISTDNTKIEPSVSTVATINIQKPNNSKKQYNKHFDKGQNIQPNYSNQTEENNAE